MLRSYKILRLQDQLLVTKHCSNVENFRKISGKKRIKSKVLIETHFLTQKPAKLPVACLKISHVSPCAFHSLSPKLSDRNKSQQTPQIKKSLCK